MNIFIGLMFLEESPSTRTPLEVLPEWRRKPWRESWEEAAQYAGEQESAALELSEEACVSCG